MTKNQNIASVNFKTTTEIKGALRTMAEEDHRSLVGQLEWLVIEEQRRRERVAAMPSRAELDNQVAANIDREEQLRSRFRPASRNVSI